MVGVEVFRPQDEGAEDKHTKESFIYKPDKILGHCRPKYSLLRNRRNDSLKYKCSRKYYPKTDTQETIGKYFSIGISEKAFDAILNPIICGAGLRRENNKGARCNQKCEEEKVVSLSKVKMHSAGVIVSSRETN